MSDSLQVYINGVLVGKLWLDQKRRFQFSYDTNWLTASTAIPLSLSLPLQGETFEDDAALPFFANLLPESDVRRALALRLGLSEQNDFALLEAVGGECAGAVAYSGEDEHRFRLNVNT